MQDKTGALTGTQPGGLRRRASDSARVGPLRRFALPDAESIWHRVLGRRGEIKRSEELTEQDRSDAASPRREVDFDHVPPLRPGENWQEHLDGDTLHRAS